MKGAVATVTPARVRPYEVVRVDISGDLIDSRSWQPLVDTAVELFTSDGWRPVGWTGFANSARGAHQPGPRPFMNQLEINNLPDPLYFRAPFKPGRYRLCFASYDQPGKEIIRKSLLAEFRVGPEDPRDTRGS